jgi:hypothetical protein
MLSFRRAAVSGAAALTALVLSAGAASAHECFNASRSDAGNAGASNSQAWFTFSVEEFAYSGEEFPAELGDCFLENWYAGGGPASFTVHVKGAKGVDGVLAQPAKPSTLSDGHGIDHIEDAYGELLGASVGACL